MEGSLTWYSKIVGKIVITIAEDYTVFFNNKPISSLTAKKYKSWFLIGGVRVSNKDIKIIREYFTFLLNYAD